MNWKIVLGLMVSFALMMSSSYTMLIPFLPVYLSKDLGATEDSVNFWSSVTFSITFAISAFVSPLWGKLSDRLGKKHMMIRASVLLTVTYFLGGMARTPLELFLVRAFQGIAAGLWPACLVMVSACVPKTKLGISMGFMQSANICGTIIGPFLGGLLATEFGIRNAFYISSAILLVITLITIIYVKEPQKTASNDIKKESSPHSYISLIKEHHLSPLLITLSLTKLVLLMIQPIVALYVTKLCSNSADSLIMSGFILSLSGFAGAVSAPLWGRLGQKGGFLNTLIVSLFSTGILMVIQGIPDTLLYFAIMQFLCGLFLSGIFPSVNSILVLLSPAGSRGTCFGLMFSSQMIGGALGPLIGGMVVTYLSFGSIYVLSGLIVCALGLFMTSLLHSGFGIKANSNRKSSIRE